MPAATLHTLVVANATPLRHAFVHWVKSLPGEHMVTSTDDPATALAVAAREPVDVLVVDAELPAPTRHVLLHHAWAGDPNIRVVMLNDGAW